MSDQPTPPAAKPRTVRCPACGGPSVYAPENRYRPFCSERCKLIDLGAWASESHTIPGDSLEDSPFSEDLPPREH